MRKLLLLAAFVLALAGCEEKEPEKPLCEIQGFGYIDVTNTSSNPYDFIVDGSTNMRIAGNTTITNIKINKGVRTVEALQVSGYIFTPTRVVKNVNIAACENHYWSVP